MSKSDAEIVALHDEDARNYPVAPSQYLDELLRRDCAAGPRHQIGKPTRHCGLPAPTQFWPLSLLSPL